MRIRTVIFLLSFLLILGGCSNTRFLAEDQLLYTGQEKINILTLDPDVNASTVKKHLQTGAPVKPNNSMFDRRVLPPIGLWVHNYWKDDEQKKVKHWIFKKVSKPPVLISDVKPELRAQKMKNDLFNQGYFQTRAWSVVDTSDRNPHKARISYSIEVDTPYRYAQIQFDSILESFDTLINEDDFSDHIESGEQFNLDKLSKEKNELSRKFQDLGYYYFNTDFIQLEADTTLRDNQINLLARSKAELPQTALSKYRIDSILVYISKSSDSLNSMLEPERYEDMIVFSSGDYLKPEVVADALYFKPGDLYSYTAYQNTIARLNKLSVFSYVKIGYQPISADSLHHLLNVRIDLIMADQINLHLETDLVMKSTGYIGPGASIGVSHNNSFKGAEKIQIDLVGGFDWQWGPKEESQLGTLSYNFGLNSGLTFPKLLLPGTYSRIKGIMYQETSIQQNFEILNRTEYYSMFSALTNYKYTWGKGNSIRHSYSPAYLNSVNLLETTPAFDSVIDENLYIRKSFEEQFILGMRYDFSYDNTYKQQLQNIKFSAGASSAGNLLDLFMGIGKDASDRPYEVLNTIYSQHVKLTTDFRYYLNGFNKTLAMRLFAGVGIPYLNSTVLPYVEQFFSGGAYSIRGFISRSLGPGSYQEEEESTYIDQSGDIKLEANLEFRFGISRITKGAVFIETGNIWLINEDVDRPGSQFNFDTFYNQLAVGAGVGLRFDFNIFVLRADLGFPIRTPYLQNDKYWLSGSGSLFSNALFYLVIGYPF